MSVACDWPARILKPSPSREELAQLTPMERRLFASVLRIFAAGEILSVNRLSKQLITTRTMLLAGLFRLEKLGFITLGEATYQDLKAGLPVAQGER